MERVKQLLFVVAMLASRVWLSMAPLAARRRQAAQGLVEYAVILVLVAIVVIGGITHTGRRISSTYTEIDCTLAGNYGTTTVANNAPPGQGGTNPGQGGGAQPHQGGSSTTGCLTP
jgi:Flp pilus assembly pilin Flp